MERRILVAVDVDGTRAAILEDGELVEYAVEHAAHQHLVGSVFLGRVQNVLPGMQAAFVDIGLERNAFLYVDQAVPLGDEESPGPARVTINELLHPGQEVVVQVVKEPMGTKGARVTRQISLPGRYVVFMPHVDYVGISRRIREEPERDRLKAIAQKVRLPNAGLIVRTVAEGAAEEGLAQDVESLQRLWGRIDGRARRSTAPAPLHRDLDLLDRVVRDWLDEATTALEVERSQTFDRLGELLDEVAPALHPRLRLFTDPGQGLFEHHGVDVQLDRALRRRLWLKSGGYLVIDLTEALTVIDVNTGKFVGGKNLADTVLRTNLEAAREIPRLLRLRDIGGMVIIDFIDMSEASHRAQVLRILEEALRRDRTRSQVLGITQLGLVEITRKKSKEALHEALTRPCPYCEGRGRILSETTMAQRVRMEIRRILRESQAQAILMAVNPAVAATVIGPGGTYLHQLEAELDRSIYIKGNDQLHAEEMHLVTVGSREEVEAASLPVRSGQILDVEVEEPHVHHPTDGITRVQGYVVNIEGAGGLVGTRVQIQVIRAFRTYAKAKLI